MFERPQVAEGQPPSFTTQECYLNVTILKYGSIYACDGLQFTNRDALGLLLSGSPWVSGWPAR